MLKSFAAEFVSSDCVWDISEILLLRQIVHATPA